jgi:nucleoside-triphosphatase
MSVTGRVLLITGMPGVGKTTLIRRVAERLHGVRLGGFYT